MKFSFARIKLCKGEIRLLISQFIIFGAPVSTRFYPATIVGLMRPRLVVYYDVIKTSPELLIVVLQ